jgi:GNAT superfamily N-acetyltransferase
MTSFRIEPLNKSHQRDEFTCGSEVLERYLKLQARQDADKRVAAPFVLTLPNSNEVLGFYTLSASLVSVDELPETFRKKLPRYPQLPVTLLGRLAAHDRHKGKGIGSFMLMDALKRSLDGASNIAVMAVVVDAKDDAAEDFYRHFGFLPCQRDPRRLFLPMKTIAGLFA